MPRSTHVLVALGYACCGTGRRKSAPSAEEEGWAAAETERILDGLPLPPAESAAKALARMRQPLVAHLSRSRRGLPPDGHLHWPAQVEQLLHTLLGLGWSPSTLASFVAKGRQALAQTAAGVQLRLDFLQREGGLTAEEASKAFGCNFGHVLGLTKISTMQRGLEQLQVTGLNAAQVRRVLMQKCQVLAKSPLEFQKKLDCLQGAKTCSPAQHPGRCNSVCLLPRSASICCICCFAYMADQAPHYQFRDLHRLWV